MRRRDVVMACGESSDRVTYEDVQCAIDVYRILSDERNRRCR